MMRRYLLTVALRVVTALQCWWWDWVALGGAAYLQRVRQGIIRRLI